MTQDMTVMPGGNINMISEQEAKRKFWNGVLIGVGTGAAVVGTGVFFATRHSERKKAREELKRCKKHFYNEGHHDGYNKAMDEAQAFINEEAPIQMRAMMEDALKRGASVIKDETVRKEVLNAALDALANSSSEELKEGEGSESDPEDPERRSESQYATPENPVKLDESTDIQNRTPEEVQQLKNLQKEAEANAKAIASGLGMNVEDIFSGKPKEDGPQRANEESENKIANVKDANEDDLEFMMKNGDIIRVPRNLLFDDKGESYGPGIVRQNIREFFGKDIRTINRLWRALGFGEFLGAELDVGNISPDELSIDEVEIEDFTKEEAYQKSIERERYLDIVDRYNAHPEEGPRIISRKEFSEETHLDQEYVDYYAGDNVFVSNANMDSPIEDPFEMYGVVNGEDLFKHKNDPDDDDPDVVHVMNFKHNFVAEITRNSRSYSEFKDGRIYT